MREVRERPDRTVRLRAAAFAMFVSLCTVNLGLPIIAAPPAAAQQDGGEQTQQEDPTQDGDGQDGADQEDGSDGSDASDGSDDSEDLPSDGSGLVCREEDQPRDAEDMNAGWWADHMQLEDLRRRVPEQGEGVTVAVLDTGLYGSNAQFINTTMATPIDLTTGSPQYVTDPDMKGFTWDCDGHGSAVAGLIVAQPEENVPDDVPGGFASDMHGVAPRATLLVVRVTTGRDKGEASDLAEGIVQAVENDADIINISIETGSHYAPLEQAVAYAQQQGVLIVAAAGNNETKAYPAAYAAKYDNVISVGSVGQSGAASEFSSPSATTIAAPGEAIVTTNRAKGHVEEQGTSFAAPLVSGVAALMMNHYDGITPTEIRKRLVATADPVAGQGGDSEITGAGVVNPVAALTAIVDMDQAGQKLEVAKYPGRYDPPPPDTMPRNVALGVAGGAIAVAVIALASLATVRRARARGWRPGS